MSVYMEIVVFLAILGSVIFVATKLLIAYLDGGSDAELPQYADGDWRNGIFRSAYLLGLNTKLSRLARAEARRKLAAERLAEQKRNKQ